MSLTRPRRGEAAQGEGRLRVWRPVIFLILIVPFFWVGNTGTKYQHSPIPAFGLTAQQEQAFRRPAVPTATPTPLVKVWPSPTPELRAAMADQNLVESKEATPIPPPVAEVEPGLEPNTLAVWITFYYCQRTVEMQDDGGGYCWTTSSGTVPHAPTPTESGTAACPPQWDGRSFTIVGDALFADDTPRVYKCEDHGSNVARNKVDIWFSTNGEGWNWPLRGEGTIVWQD